MTRILSLLAVLALAPGCAWLTDYKYEEPGKKAPAKAESKSEAAPLAAASMPEPAPAESTLNNEDIYLIEHEGRLYVFDDEAVYQSFMSHGETAYRLVRVGEGPGGSTLVFGLRDEDKEKREGIAAVDMYDGRLAGAAEGFYAEVLHDGRFYVFSEWDDLVAFQRTRIADLRYTEIGAGPGGRTVVYVLNESNKKEKPLSQVARFKRIHGQS
ncbi:MAG: hypothetical protein R3352_08070 [Salinisphaeraceae bacterium]|nr:hypothetical protein [Salinisphaeraceae bacterium]